MIPDLRSIDPDEVYELNIQYMTYGNALYYSYTTLYDFWLMSEAATTLEHKINDPKLPTDPSLNMTDFIALGNYLATYGYIG